MKLKLARTKQCAKCPWKKGTDPNAIPNGYSVKKHKALKGTVAKPGELRLDGPMHVMACHDSEVGNESHCIGWLVNQLTIGNNIGLRFRMMDYDLSGIELDGEQHERFKDTLPPRVRTARKV